MNQDNSNKNCALENEVFAKDQNTVYNPNTNTMLYGINRNMKVLGVSDGTCNQINPLMYTDNYKCGFGAAGGNKCFPNVYKDNNYGIENFEGGCSMNYDIYSIILVAVLIIFILIIISKNNDDKEFFDV